MDKRKPARRFQRHNTQRKPMSQQQQAIQIAPMQLTGRVWFAPQAILAADLSGYVVGDKDRVISLYIVGPHVLDLVGQDADAFNAWWDQVTGTARIQAPPTGLKLT